MELKRRFIFRGNATAFGGRLIRPVDIILEDNGASSLSVAGGRSQSRVGAQQFGDEVRFESASTFAEGLFDDAKQFDELTFQRVREDALTTSTRVNSEVRGLSVGLKPRLTVSRIRAALHSKSPAGSGETPIGPGENLALAGIAIDGYKLIVELDAPLFQRYDTRAKLVAAADDPVFVRDHGDCLLMRSEFEGRFVPPSGRLIGCELIHATLARRVRWDGPPFPGAQIDHHMVIVPDFGRIFLAELLIAASSRRLTMLRLELGSPASGRLCFGDAETNGGWSP